MRCYLGNTNARDADDHHIVEASDDLKKRAASAAHELGMSPHAFWHGSAIEQAAIATEQRLQFVAEARSAREQMIETRKGWMPMKFMRI